MIFVIKFIEKVNINQISSDEIEHDFLNIKTKMECDECHNEIINIIPNQRPFNLNNSDMDNKINMVTDITTESEIITDEEVEIEEETSEGLC